MMGKDKPLIDWNKLRKHNMEMSKVHLRMISKTHLSNEQMEKIISNNYLLANDYGRCIICKKPLEMHVKLELTEEHIFYEGCDALLYKVHISK